MRFRQVAKEPLGAQVPGPVADAVRERASRERRSLSSVTTELLCQSLGMDPARFGLEPVKPRGRHPASPN